jgi:phosphoglucosamine mutase
LSRKYFGTDGVRGRVGQHPMTVDALRLANKQRGFCPEGGKCYRKTRPVGYVRGLEAGFVAVVDVFDRARRHPASPMTQRLLRFRRCDRRAHNLYDDNGTV